MSGVNAEKVKAFVAHILEECEQEGLTVAEAQMVPQELTIYFARPTTRRAREGVSEMWRRKNPPGQATGRSKGETHIQQRKENIEDELATMLVNAYEIVSLVKDCFDTEKKLEATSVRRISFQIKAVKEQLLMTLENCR